MDKLKVIGKGVDILFVQVPKNKNVYKGNKGAFFDRLEIEQRHINHKYINERVWEIYKDFKPYCKKCYKENK